MDDNREVRDKTIKEFPEILLDNGYKIIPRIKEFSDDTACYQVLSLNLYNGKFIKSVALPLDKIRTFTNALNKIAQELEIEKYEKRCGNCCSFRTGNCWFGRNAPILQRDTFAVKCAYFENKYEKRHICKE